MLLEHSLEQEHTIPEAVRSTPVPHDALTRANESSNEQGHAKFRMMLQTALAIRHVGNEQTKILDWVEQYSEAFRNFYDAMIDADPLIFNSYQTVGDILDDADMIMRIEQGLYK